MKNVFFLKLGIGIVAGFGLLLAGFYVYEPVWFKIQEYRLLSDDPATRDSAAAAIAEKGEIAIPFVRKWLGSESDKLVIGACKALENMSGDEWKEVFPQIESVLKNAHSEITDSAAAVLWKKNVIGDLDEFNIVWGNYNYTPVIKKNICLYILTVPHESMWHQSAFQYFCIRGDRTVVPELLRILETSPKEFDRHGPIKALGMIGDKRAVEPLINTLKNDSGVHPREYAAIALGQIGDIRAIEPLIATLENQQSALSTRESTAWVLGVLNDSRAIPALINSMEKDNNSNVKAFAAFALASFPENEMITNALKSEVKNTYALISLAWINGGEFLDLAKSKGIFGGMYKWMLSLAKARWGDQSGLDEIMHPNLVKNDVYGRSYDCVRFYSDIYSRMPDDFPEFDFKANYETREKQAENIQQWYNNNKSRLAWDAEKRKYYLKPEESGNK
jgi:HEAT repeat protein